MPEYVYTAKGEARARELGQTDRREGEVAMFGHRPVYGPTAQAWLEKGYIVVVAKNATVGGDGDV